MQKAKKQQSTTIAIIYVINIGNIKIFRNANGNFSVRALFAFFEYDHSALIFDSFAPSVIDDKTVQPKMMKDCSPELSFTGKNCYTGCLRKKYRCLIEYSIKAEAVTKLK